MDNDAALGQPRCRPGYNDRSRFEHEEIFRPKASTLPVKEPAQASTSKVAGARSIDGPGSVKFRSWLAGHDSQSMLGS